MDFQPFEPEADRSEYRRYLPHWSQPGCTYFVTFRLGDSLPESTLREWKHERTVWLMSHGLRFPEEITRLPKSLQREFHRHFSRRMHDFLDAGQGSCILRDPKVSQIVASAFLFFDRQRCAVGNFVVMPNHAHLLVTPCGKWELKDLLHSWKRHSSREINKVLGKQGSLWMEENFDHIVRSPEQLNYFRQYIQHNPIKARLHPTEFALGCGSDVQT